MRREMALGLTLGFVLSCGATSSALAGMIYTDKLDWEQAVGGLFETEDFNDSIMNDGVSFTSSESGNINPALGYYQDVLQSASQNEPMTTWYFDPAVTGHLQGYGGGWDLGGPGGSGNSLRVYVNDLANPNVYTELGSISSDFGNFAFWGFTSENPFSSVRLIGGTGSNQQNYRLDDMVYAESAPAVVPVPAPLGLVIGGLFGLLAFRRRSL